MVAPGATTAAHLALEALLEAGPVDLVLLDAEGRCTHASAGRRHLVGLAVQDALGPEAAALAARAAVGEAPITGRLRDGEDATAVPVPGTGGLWLALGDTSHRRAAEAATALVRSGARLADAVEPDAVLEALANAAVPDLADWCAIHVARHAEPPALAAVAHADPQRRAEALALQQRFPPGREGIVPAVLAEGVPVVLSEVTEADLRASARVDEHLDALRAMGPRSAAVLPLTARGLVLGTITLVFAESDRRYDERMVAAAEALAAQAAVVLDNARLYGEQVEVARTLQRSLLPSHLPDVDGLDLAVRYRPAGRANEVGGDFYDVVAAQDGVWRLLVGDIAGKGAEAAALTSLVRHTLAAAALRDRGMDADMRLANDALRVRTAASTFCTVAYASARLAGDGVELSVLTAGHPPALVVRKGGAVEPLPSSGPVLGVLQTVRFEPAAARLEPGDAVVLYTDGAIEVRGVTADEGERRLREVLAAAAGRTAAELLEHIEHHTLVLGGGAPRDDLALLALRVPD